MQKPSTVQLSDICINNIKGTSWTCEAVILACSSAKPCKNVTIGNVDLGFSGPKGPITTKCANVKPIFTGKQNPPVCAVAPA